MEIDIPKVDFIFFTDLARCIHNDRTGFERRELIRSLSQWLDDKVLSVFTEQLQRSVLEQTIGLALEIAGSAFIPPWEEKEEHCL